MAQTWRVRQRSTALQAEDPPRLRILIVEPNAHVEAGHCAVIFAERAADLIELGCEVEVLTSEGWALAGDPSLPRLEIHRYGRVARAVDQLARRLRGRPLSRRLRLATRSAIAVVAARVRRRKMRATAVVLFPTCDERVASLLAGPGCWLIHQTQPPRPFTRSATGRLANWGARQVELHRERRGGRMRAAYATEVLLEVGLREVPWLSPRVIPFATVREHREMATKEARATLGLPEGTRLALFFGIHAGKDLEVTLQAFSRLPAWQLVVAGSGARKAVVRWGEHATGQDMPIVFDGFASETTRALLHSAVDLVVVSYRPSQLEQDSGTLMDALSWALPVVCTNGGSAAHLVRTHGLGTVFEPGDVDALVAAVRAAPEAPDPDGLARARSGISGRRIAQQLLDALTP